jgi:glutathione S-transferase
LEDRAKVDQWLDYTNIHIGIPATELAWNKYWSKIFGHQEDALRSQKLEQRINKELYILERNLEQHHFLLSNTISLADISFLPMAHNLKMAQVSLERYPATQAWYNALINRNPWMRVKQKFINPK